MSPELIAGLVAFLLALIGGGAAWVRADQHGRTSSELEAAEEKLDHAEKRIEAATAPPASRSEASGVLRARLARGARRLRRLRGVRQGRE